MSNEYSPPDEVFVSVRRSLLETVINSHPRFRDYSDAIEEIQAVLKNYPKNKEKNNE
jgi:hypothetical protein